MDEDHGFRVRIEPLRDLEFNVKFDWPGTPELRTDEPRPLGGQTGPNAARLIAAGVGNCLAASLLFCLKKSRVEPRGVSAEVAGTLARNDRGRLRLGPLTVRLVVDGAGEHEARLERCLGLFEDYCVVTESIRQGVPVAVEVVDDRGRTLRAAQPA